jgi:hypothetical protein
MNSVDQRKEEHYIQLSHDQCNANEQCDQALAIGQQSATAKNKYIGRHVCTSVRPGVEPSDSVPYYEQ